jgi:hypothetical protein
VRSPTDSIVAPLFPTSLRWVNTNGAYPKGHTPMGAGRQASILKRGQPMLVEFWDFCRPNSIRTLPYVKEWHARYEADGLRTVGVHCGGFEPSRDEQAVRDAVARLGIEHPVLIDNEFELWREYENRGWPARYLFDGRARLFDYHYGEGGYLETELAIQELLGVKREPLAPLRAEDAPGARLLPQSEERAGAWSGPYKAGAVWAVLVPPEAYPEGAFPEDTMRRAGSGTVTVRTIGDRAPANERTLTVEHPGAYMLIEHERHTHGVLALEVGEDIECLATCFTPGIA